MGFMSYDDFCKLLGIPHKPIEERDDNKFICWSDEDDDPEYYTGEDLMMYWDDRWMNNSKGDI